MTIDISKNIILDKIKFCHFQATTMTMMRYLWWSLLSLAAVTAEDECRLYMAESSTSTAEEPKWGIYAGVDFGEHAQLGEPDVAIQFHNLMAHAMDEGDVDGEEHDSLERKTVELLERFMWIAQSSGGSRELNGEGKVTTVLPGTALLAAYNGKLTNSAFNHTSSYFRTPVGEEPGVAHPGRGASSHFYNVALFSKTLIPAGFELFMDYGENFADDDEESKLHASDFEKVDQLVDNMIDFMDKHKDELNETSKQEIYNFVIHDVMAAAAGAKKGKLISDMLPDNPDELTNVKEAGGSFVYASPQVKRDLEWLQKEGFCMDNLAAGASTIPHAGRGAFARRALKKDEIIAPVPLIHVPEKAILAMHELDEDASHRISKDEVVGQQLFLNYCLGHPESSALLFPAGGLVPLINHDSKSPNAKLVWSKHSKHHSDWFEKNPAQLAEEEFAYLGLLMELVATRNIKKGEEVFIDYGKEWEDAWSKHVQEWNDKVASGKIKSEWPLRALDLNQEYKNKAFKTQAELEKDPYPENVSTHCFLYVKVGGGEDDTKPKPWGVPPVQTVYHTEYLYPCNVTDRKALEGERSYNYTVVVGQKLKVTITDLPQKAVIFRDEPETSDQFVKDAFRHPIGIPDEMFPKGWKDLANE